MLVFELGNGCGTILGSTGAYREAKWPDGAAGGPACPRDTAF